MKNSMLLFSFLAVACALALSACAKKMVQTEALKSTSIHAIEAGKPISYGAFAK
jgi:hypothetical protein